MLVLEWSDLTLLFIFRRYGRPDPMMERPFDISAKVQMASVRYLHTMRFLKEIIAFLSHFPQLIDAFQRMKAMAQGNLVSIRVHQMERGSVIKAFLKTPSLSAKSVWEGISCLQITCCFSVVVCYFLI